MPTNTEVASIFRELADMLVQKHENWFKIRAYRKVADEIEKLTLGIGTIERDGKLRQIPGVGEAIERKIKEILETGKLHNVEDLKTELRGAESDRPAGQ